MTCCYLCLRAQGRQAQKLCSSPFPNRWWTYSAAYLCYWERTPASSCLPGRLPEILLLAVTAQGISLLQNEVSLSIIKELESAFSWSHSVEMHQLLFTIVILLKWEDWGFSASRNRNPHLCFIFPLRKEQCYKNIWLQFIRGHCIFVLFPRDYVLMWGTQTHVSGW